MLYAFYEYLANGKNVILIFKFKSDEVRRIADEDQYSYDVRAKEVLFSHNVKLSTTPEPIPFNMSHSQLENWTSDKLSDVVKITIKFIFRKFSAGRL